MTHTHGSSDNSDEHDQPIRFGRNRRCTKIQLVYGRLAEIKKIKSFGSEKFKKEKP